ncbi:period circadian protein homolog 3 [Megalops cyprinoides]|uniref:period circadian protein homolog 3 n=1 Tax=Megalops cyprinoides TaxID=118141 RepID=UPI001863CE83|nr:period circadian protein homolog 3 [Megalops cyprinoides]
MNSGHDSSSGNDCAMDSCGRSSSTNRSSRSTTGSGSTKSSKFLAGSSSCSLHSGRLGEGAHRTEGSGSDQQERERDRTHREMMQTVQEMKKRLPSEKKSRSKASTVEALNYALNCVKQVQANSEYYKLLMSNGLEKRKETTVCTLEELESITSEHTLKNTDTFVVVFSLTSGRVLYVSEQASCILNCKRKFLDSVKFVELLYHQDVNVFYSHTAQPHLPPWNVGSDSGVLFECSQVKSFFCRIRGGKDRDGELRYNPFRIAPYLLKVQGVVGGEEEQPCCLALAERIISGYEAPRIPMDKRIFTTTHSPGCVFLEVDDRAVPLLGYLPQDLIGTSVLTCLHPEDRTLMLAMHRKILKYAGQPPFEHSPIRFRCQNGDYITLDTSWSSFINPWSRKVAFIIGRHKVRTGPLNEDVFAARSKGDLPVIHEEIKELQAQIYKLFLQPVHNNGSSGYGSLGSNGSHEHYISVASSSDSNGNLWEDTHREPMTLQQICADVNKVKSWGQQAYLDSRRKLTPIVKASTGPRAPLPHPAQNVEVRGHHGQSHEESRKQPHVPSYQQINCVDSIIRYLESCTVPALKRKSESLSIATSSSSSSTSEEDKTPAALHEGTAHTEEVALVAPGVPDSQVSAESAAAVVGAPLTDITLSTKAMSVVSVTSQCSYSSTIVHVPQPESEVTALEDAPMGSEQADPAPPPPRPQPSSAAAPEEFRVVGLTKEVLSAHTQKEEQEYVDRFRHRILQSPYSSYLQQDDGSMAHSHHHGDQAMRPVSAGGWNKSKTGKPKHKRPKPQCSSDSYASPPGNCRPPRRTPVALDSSWPPSESSQRQPTSDVGFMPPLVMPFQHPYFMLGQVGGDMMGSAPMTSTLLNPAGQQSGVPFVLRPDQTLQPMQPVQPMQPLQPMQSMQPMQPVQPMQPMQPVQPMQPMQPMQPVQGMSPYMAPVMALILPNFPTYPNYPMYPQGMPPAAAPAPPLLPQPYNIAGFAPAPFPMAHTPQTPNLVSSPSAPPFLSSPKPPSSLGEDLDATQPPALFSSSRSSSPLQLNLLQEELPKPAEPQSSVGRAESLHEQRAKGEDAPSESGNHDAQSTSSELLDLLLHEDARSGTGSNASGSGSGESGGSLGSGSGSGSNGTSTSHTGSSNSSKYFASNDSSDTSRKARKSQEPLERPSFDKCVEDSLWTMIQRTPEPVMMTYQIHTRDQAQVLKEDREKLLLLQPLQPWFTQEQKEELAEVHPWIQQHTLPQEIDTQGCVGCCAAPNGASPPQSPQSPHSPRLQTPDTSCPLNSPPEDESPAPDT